MSSQVATVGCRKDVLDLGWVLRRCPLSFILDIPFLGEIIITFSLILNICLEFWHRRPMSFVVLQFLAY